MNEKIKELAEMAGIVIIPNSRPISIMGLTTDLEKFAELIVKECSAPPQHPWVGLTDEEIEKIAKPFWDGHLGYGYADFDSTEFARAIEAAHGIKP